MKRLLAMVLVWCCLCPAALAGGGPSGGKNAHLTPQEGAYSPRYSISGTYEVLPQEAFTVIVYEDDGALPLEAVRNGGSLPPGVTLVTRVVNGVRQVCITGTVLAEGEYSFGLMVQECEDNGETRMLAILHAQLHVTRDAQLPEPYLGDGLGMVRVIMDGVNFRRTPGGKRLDTLDEDTRLVWCSTQEKGGYTWYRVWTEDYGYGWICGDMLQVEPPMRIVYTPGRETAFTLFITPGDTRPLTPTLIMTEAPEVIGFDHGALSTAVRDGATWTTLRFCIDEAKAFFIQVDLRDEEGVPLECQLVYLTTQWESVPPYTNN